LKEGIPYQYGYGDQYRQTALEAMAKAKWLPAKYRGRSEKTGCYYAYLYESENNYPIYWNECFGTKKECIAHGKEG
jgi:hypothetical protein